MLQIIIKKELSLNNIYNLINLISKIQNLINLNYQLNYKKIKPYLLQFQKDKSILDSISVVKEECIPKKTY